MRGAGDAMRAVMRNVRPLPAPPRAVTFDFHDTVAVAPRWFALEVRELPTATLHALRDAGEVAWDAARDDEATAAYRAMRAAVAVSGIERDALDGTQHTLRAVGVAVPDEIVSATIYRLMRDARADAHPRPGIAEAVRTLRDAGMPLAVVSSAVYHPFLEWCLTEWGLREAFVAVVSSASCGYYKSHPGIYRHTLDLLRCAPKEVVHVGDSYRYDVEAAHALGIRTVWLNLRGEDRPDNEADLTIPDLDGLASRLLNGG